MATDIIYYDGVNDIKKSSEMKCLKTVERLSLAYSYNVYISANVFYLVRQI